jgi:DNA-binding transcriptional MocR family regulator
VLLTLDASSHKPLYAQIRDQLRGRIASGVLKPGDRLEPSRELAKLLGVHRTTVGNAYADLEAEGLIEGTVGRGTFVSARAGALGTSSHAPRRAGNDLFWESVLAQEPRDDSLGRLMASALEPGIISFATAGGSEEIDFADCVRRAVDAVLRREGAKLLQYGSSDGYSPLKRYLQARLGRDGISVELDEILITNGCQQSLDLLRHSLVGPGDAVACENPTYTGLWQVFESPAIRLIGVPVASDGLDLDFLAAVLEQSKVKLILVSPNFQNPTGRTMPLANRRRLLELALRYQVPVVEDDIYGPLRYTGRELPPLKSLDPAGLVIYLNSFSKVGFPGFRVGWIVASRRVIEILRRAKQRDDLHTNLLTQAVLEELGRRGWLDKLIRRMRQAYLHKLEVLQSAIARHFPQEARIDYPQGGMSVWVELPGEVDSVELLAAARDQGVIFAPSRYFYFQNPRHNAFRLCFTALPDDKIEKGVEVLGAVLKSAIRKGRRSRKHAPAGTGVALV